LEATYESTNYEEQRSKINETMNIIITGAGRGIGFETTRELLRKGNHLVIAISRNTDHLAKLEETVNAEKSTGKLITIACDLGKPGFEAELFSKINRHLTSVNILINNAGVVIRKDFGKYSNDDFDHLVNVNTRAPFFLIQSLLPLMERGSHIVNISSMGGFMGSMKFPGLALYSMAKGAVSILTEALAEELKGRYIRVNCLALGAVQTEMLEEAFPGYRAPVEPKHMAGFIAGFALEAHSFINGKVIPVSLSTP
jgi:3-oxoacyl-[acyl-carrier protein] reductase